MAPKHDRDGNTIEPEKKDEDKKRVVPKKYWVFTWHGGVEGMGFDAESPIWKETCRYITMNCTHASFQEERCPMTGRHHIQGMVAFEKKKRFNEIKELKHISYNQAAKASELSNKAYTTKSETAVPGGLWYVKGFTIIKKVLTPEQIAQRPWQKMIWDMCKTECDDDRSIYWFWESEGGKGKTAMVKALIHHMDAFYFEGKTSDIAFRITQKRLPPKIALMNLRRSQETHVNYNAIESLKDGLVATGKYEGGQKIFDPPHVIVFANFAPETSALSADRWKIYNI